MGGPPLALAEGAFYLPPLSVEGPIEVGGHLAAELAGLFIVAAGRFRVVVLVDRAVADR